MATVSSNSRQLLVILGEISRHNTGRNSVSTQRGINITYSHDDAKATAVKSNK